MAEPLVAEGASLEEVREFFAKDRFATLSLAPVVEEVRVGYARVSMAIEERHLNGMGSLMGGASFTLADFAFAIASNVGQAPTVSVGSTIDYLGVPRTERIVAECEMEKDGKSLCFARVWIADDAGNPVARVSVTGMRKR